MTSFKKPYIQIIEINVHLNWPELSSNMASEIIWFTLFF